MKIDVHERNSNGIEECDGNASGYYCESDRFSPSATLLLLCGIKERKLAVSIGSNLHVFLCSCQQLIHF